MSRQFLRNRKIRRASHRKQRLGVQLESLELRQLMHGESVLNDAALDPPVLAAAEDVCIDFEDLKVGGVYHVGDTFVADSSGFQASITGEPFTWSNGMTTAGGFAEVANGNLAGHFGQDIGINNILLNFKFDRTPTGMVMRFGEYGGNLNLEINGDFRNIDNFQDIDGQVIGGTLVQIPAGGLGNDQGAMVVIGEIHSFKIGGQELWIDHVCVRDRQEFLYDYGDAPDRPYPTLEANNGAKHRVDPQVHLGRLVDAESDGQPSLLANGDDQIGGVATDDEDGVKFLTPLIPGQEAKVEVVASVDGWLNAWLDFNRNGEWQSGTQEELFSGLPIHAGSNILSFMVPASAVGSNERPAFSRWRFSTTDQFLKPESSSRIVPNGEVEDHAVRIREVQREDYDWGDAPDKPYPTLAASGGAFHKIDPKVHLGERVEGEADGQPTLASNGDDQVGGVNVDDEDGVRFLSPLIPGQAAKVEVIASVDGWLNAWIDFDRDGDWTSGPDDRIFMAEPLSAGVNILSFMVPADAKPEPNRPTYSRWRFSNTDRVLRPTQPRENVPNGEVEDHLVFIQQGEPDARLDWGDAPDRPYRTLKIHGGAVHEIDPKVYLGNGVDAELDGQPNANAQGDDTAGADDEDGIDFTGPLVRGQVNQVKVTASVDGWVNAWIDFNQNGSWETGTAEAIFVSQPVVAGVNLLSFFVPATAAQNGDLLFSRWRFSNTHKELWPFLSSPEGSMPNGEVEDHLLRAKDPDPQGRFDFGDAPDPSYPTRLANDGARHAIDPKVYLGNGVDAELNGQGILTASGDDANGIDDEDGVKFLTPVLPGTEVKYEVLASTDGKLDAWVDFNQDGQWDASETIAASVPIVGGVNTLSFVMPGDALPSLEKPTYARFRFSTSGGLGPKGVAADGEVEDYMILNGDQDHDGVVSPADANQLCRAIHSGNLHGDLNGDGLVNDADMDYLIKTIMGTSYGDANWDGVFDSADLVHVFAVGEYEDQIAKNSGWSDGDWNCDGDFDSSDLIKAFQDGGYEQPAAAVPATHPGDAGWLAEDLDSATRRKSIAALDELFAVL